MLQSLVILQPILFPRAPTKLEMQTNNLDKIILAVLFLTLTLKLGLIGWIFCMVKFLTVSQDILNLFNLELKSSWRVVQQYSYLQV